MDHADDGFCILLLGWSMQAAKTYIPGSSKQSGAYSQLPRMPYGLSVESVDLFVHIQGCDYESIFHGDS